MIDVKSYNFLNVSNERCHYLEWIILSHVKNQNLYRQNYILILWYLEKYSELSSTINFCNISYLNFISLKTNSS